MGKHIITYGFVANYTQWICHGEAHRARDEVLRQRIKDFDDEAGCRDMLEDFHQANFASSPCVVIQGARQWDFTVQKATVRSLLCAPTKNARQRLCHAFFGLCHAPVVHGKPPVSRSV
jgi:hypothetical protein